MTELQSKLFSMLKWFHEYCKTHGLRYYLIGGTALGAARHQGFIPWDDDIDVGMPRADYEKLKTLRREETGRYRFEFPGEAKEFVYSYGKLYDTTTTMVENRRYKAKRGIFLDIFPLDGAGDTREEGIERFKALNKKVDLLSTRTCAWRKGRKLYKNLAIILMRLVPSCICGSKKLLGDIEKLSVEKNFDECKYVANFLGAWREKEIAERSVFGEPTEYTFEGATVYGPQNIDGYLTAVYGDWRTPPPPEKRVTHHDFLYLDLRESYLETKKGK